MMNLILMKMIMKYIEYIFKYIFKIINLYNPFLNYILIDLLFFKPI